jgi:hypothetical protein
MTLGAVNLNAALAPTTSDRHEGEIPVHVDSITGHELA